MLENIETKDFVRTIADRVNKTKSVKFSIGEYTLRISRKNEEEILRNWCFVKFKNNLIKEEKNIENQKYTLKSISEDINPIDNEKDKNLITVIVNYIMFSNCDSVDVIITEKIADNNHIKKVCCLSKLNKLYKDKWDE